MRGEEVAIVLIFLIFHSLVISLVVIWAVMVAKRLRKIGETLERIEELLKGGRP